MNQERPVLYINILVHDASEAVKNEVAAKVKKSRIPRPLKEPMANRAAARVTWDSITAAKVVDKMGPRLCQEIPIKMSRKGILVHVENVFTEGNYIVLELQVQHVDAVVMTEAKHKSRQDDVHNGTLTSGLFKGIYTVIGANNRDSIEHEVLPNIVQRKVSVSIREMMQEKLAEKKMTADVEILQEEKQARFFFTTLKAVRECNAPVDTPKKGPADASTNKKETTSADTHVRMGSLSDIVDAATAAVTSERVKYGLAPAPTAKKCSMQKKGSRSNKLNHAVEAAAATAVSTVKKGAFGSSPGRKEKLRVASAAAKRNAIF